MMLLKPRLWFQFKTLPIMIFTCFDFFSAYLLPANSIVLMYTVWNEAVEGINTYLELDITIGTILFWWILVQLIVAAITNIGSSDMFYAISSFFGGAMMAIFAYWFITVTVYGAVTDFVADPVSNYPILVMIAVFPLLHLIVSVPKPQVQKKIYLYVCVNNTYCRCFSLLYSII